MTSGPGQLSLLLDLGSSAIKAQVVSSDPEATPLVELGSPMPSPQTGLRPSRHETDPAAIIIAVRSVLERALAEVGLPVSRIAISSQMHSALLTDTDDRPLTPLISWQDDRLAEPSGEQTVLDRLLAGVSADTRQRSGVARRPGIGGLNLAAALADTPELPGRLAAGGVRLHTLGSLVSTSLGGPHVTHLSAAAALGLVDLDQQVWSAELVSGFGLGGVQLPQIATEFASVGQVQVLGRPLDLYPEVGDHQASVLGGGGLAAGEVAISLGTAGIIARWAPERRTRDDVDSRPYPRGGYLLAVSRLPGGRLAEDLIGFIAAVSGVPDATARDPDQIWARAADLAGPAPSPRPIQVREDLRPGGGRGLAITGAHSGPSVVADLLHGLTNHFVEQYRQAITLLHPDGDLPHRAHFNGGLAMRSPWFRERLSTGLDLEVIDYPHRDLALAGLQRLLQSADARRPSPEGVRS